MDAEARRRAEDKEQMLLEYLMKAYKLTPQSWSQVKLLVDGIVADTVAQAGREILYWGQRCDQAGQERDELQKKYDDAMAVLTQWDHIDKAEAIATCHQQAEEIARLKGELNVKEKP